jgi:hypothetical protein
MIQLSPGTIFAAHHVIMHHGLPVWEYLQRAYAGTRYLASHPD